MKLLLYQNNQRKVLKILQGTRLEAKFSKMDQQVLEFGCKESTTLVYPPEINACPLVFFGTEQCICRAHSHPVERGWNATVTVSEITAANPHYLEKWDRCTFLHLLRCTSISAEIMQEKADVPTLIICITWNYVCGCECVLCMYITRKQKTSVYSLGVAKSRPKMLSTMTEASKLPLCGYN